MNSTYIIIFYVILLAAFIIPTYLSGKKKRKKIEDMMASMKIGDKVVSVGGIHGTISKIDVETVDIKIDKGVSLKLAKEAISKVIK